MKPITDPNLIEKLNASVAPQQEEVSRRVEDPAVLEKLNEAVRRDATRDQVDNKLIDNVYQIFRGIYDEAPATQAIGVADAATGLPVINAATKAIGVVNPAVGLAKDIFAPKEFKDNPRQYITKMSDEEYKAASFKERNRVIEEGVHRELTKPFTDMGFTVDESDDFRWARLAGMLFDPTTLLPIGGATTLRSFLIGSGVGAGDTALWSLGETGEVDPKLTLFGAAAGGTLSAGARALTNKMSKSAVKAEVKQAERKAVDIADYIQASILGRAEKEGMLTAFRGALKELQMTQKEVNEVLGSVEGLPRIDSGINKWLQSYGRYTTHIKDTNMQKWRNKFKWLPESTREGAANLMYTIDKGIEPISAGVRKRSERVWGLLRRYEAGSIQRQHKTLQEVDPLAQSLEKIKKANPEKFSELKYLALNLDRKGNAALFQQAIEKLGLKSDWEKAQKAFKQSGEEYAKLDSKFSMIEHYFPRRVKDFKKFKQAIYKGLSETEKTRLDALLHGHNTPAKQTEILTNFIAGRYAWNKKTGKLQLEPNSAKARRIEEIKPEWAEHYYDPQQALHMWARDAAEGIEKQLFMGRLHSTAKATLEANNGNINTTIKDIFTRHLGSTEDAAQEVADLLDIRFNGIHKATGGVTRRLKNSTYFLLLTNPISAITQLGDLAFIAYRAGLINTVRAMLPDSKFAGKGVSPKELGIMQTLTAEFVDQPGHGKWTAGAMKWGGFTYMDQFSKRTAIRAFANKYQKSLSTSAGKQKFLKKYAPAFTEAEMTKLMRDFRAGNFDDWNVKNVLLSEVADIQPIFPSELPPMYWDNPKMRFFYTLRSFTIKHIDLIRQTVREEFANGNFVGGYKALLGLSASFTAANLGTDALKEYVLAAGSIAKGETRPEDVISSEKFGDMIWANVLKNTALLTKYDLDIMSSNREPIMSAAGVFAPPLNVFDPLAVTVRDMARGVTPQVGVDEVTNKIPVIGRIYTAWAGVPFVDDKSGYKKKEIRKKRGEYYRERSQYRRENRPWY
jgi:hypothetical protein